MGTTSLQYNFMAISADEVIKDAFERCGVLNWAEDRIKYSGARRSLNFILSHMVNKYLNLFTVHQGLIPIIPGVGQYALPDNLSKILECKQLNMTNSATNSTGTPSSSQGAAAGCFSGAFASPCVQTTANGWISYLFTQPTPVLYVGVMTAITTLMSFQVQCSYLTNPTDNDWITILETSQQQYYFGETQWFCLPYTKNAMNWRLLATDGTIFNLAQVYFSVPALSVMMARNGRDTYFAARTNIQQGASTTYWVNRSIQPTINVYPFPNDDYAFYNFNYVRSIQDVDSFWQSIDVNSRFLNWITAQLAVYVGGKIPDFDLNKLQLLSAEADRLFIEAGREDSEDVTLKVEYSDDGTGYN